MPREKMSGHHINKLLMELNQSSVLKYIPLVDIQKSLGKLNLRSERIRSLPAESIVYLVILMALHADVSIMEVLRVLLYSIRSKLGIDNSKLPVGSAIVKARRRLGVQVFSDIFDTVVRPLGNSGIRQCFWKKYRMVAVDGSSQNVHATKENKERFGSPRSGSGDAKNPQMKIVALMECGTKIFFAVSYGAYKLSELALFKNLIGKLSKEMLLFADRGYFSFELWRQCKQKAGALIWRVNKSVKLIPVKKLRDGSYLARIRPSSSSKQKNPALNGQDDIVRVVKFKPVFKDGSQGEEIRLVTTILSENEASAREIAEIYPERWLIEEGFCELKSCLGNAKEVLRSLIPEFVIQELFGFLLMHFVVRRIMLESAQQNDMAPNDLSFKGTVNIVKRQIIAFSPSGE